MYFDAAEAKLTDLDNRTAALEAAPGSQAQIDVLVAQVSALASAVATLDARLDAIAAGAVG